ncbi:4-alpha-glucanotransferase [Halorubraceae archaeon YAN]|nr:4-alpha-glucanotransferase [Halorubraceae archaeon YAN]
MQFDRASGVFLHISSLPSQYGIGDLGDGARLFLDFLASAEQQYWQFCPLGPTSAGLGNSPYQSYSAFAGNPLFIDLEQLKADGWLSESDCEPVPPFDDHAVAYDAVTEYKEPLLRTAVAEFEETATADEQRAVDAFVAEHSWVTEYATYMALKNRFDEQPWPSWPDQFRNREPAAIETFQTEAKETIRYHIVTQYWFDTQWQSLRDAAADRGISLVGDLPIYVGLDSADVWANPDAFQLNDENEPTAVAGVPPNPGDDGQRWGNPLYDWDALREDGYGWWIDRLERLFSLVDVTRLDHFQGFLQYWAIPADADSPAAGAWRDGPQDAFFESIDEELGSVPFIAEDLGFPDEELYALMDRFNLPGMRVPIYSDWCQEGSTHQPIEYPHNVVGYTSTHDTDTFVGYYDDLDDRQRGCLHYNLGVDGSEISWSIIKAVWESDAVLAFTPMWDLLGLDSHARYNTPGTLDGNWQWRCTAEGFAEEIAARLADLTDRYNR